MPSPNPTTQTPAWASALTQSQPGRAMAVPVYAHAVEASPQGRAVETDVVCPRTDHRQMLYLHPDLRAKLDALTFGPRASVIVALVDWALDELQSHGQLLKTSGR